ncbi:hypothetical protein ACFP2T_13525 [Plantactinospora solaniradicis]|uniref:Uncharacterized protein n=1 Tax=Plantactinospora solaniradicis TaxID=1723736 RepID=A0ABW1K8T7_9ACTN
MRDLVTTILDVLGLLLLAAGLAAAAYLLIGWACLVVAGAVVLGGSQLAAYLTRTRRAAS